MKAEFSIARCNVNKDYIIVTATMVTSICPVWWKFWKWEKRLVTGRYRTRIIGGCPTDWHTFPDFKKVTNSMFLGALNELVPTFVEQEKYIADSEKL